MRIRSACAASNGDAPSIVTLSNQYWVEEESKQRRAATNSETDHRRGSDEQDWFRTSRVTQPRERRYMPYASTIYESEDDARVARVNRN